MKNSKKSLIIVGVLFMALFQINALANDSKAKGERWVYASDPSPPFIVEVPNRLPKGISVDRVEKTLKLITDKPTVATILPWKRALAEAEVGKVDIIGPMLYDEKKDYLIFTEPIYKGKLLYYYKKSNERLKSHNFDYKDKLVRYGYILGYNYEKNIDAHILTNPANFVQFKSIESALQALNEGRIDAYIGLDLVTNSVMKSEKMDLDKFATGDNVILTTTWVFGISKKSKLSQHIKMINQKMPDL